MKIDGRKMLGLIGLVCHGYVFAQCPSHDKYSVIEHNAFCIYTSSATIPLEMVTHNQKICPNFLITEPKYQNNGCTYDSETSRCICTITRKQQ